MRKEEEDLEKNDKTVALKKGNNGNNYGYRRDG